ncbi:hypothetical protein BLOT_003043 [Blomia tropicalis]|nr:hypothetical protein BLOT_003043 [Blomia tropicalis]
MYSGGGGDGGGGKSVDIGKSTQPMLLLHIRRIQDMRQCDQIDKLELIGRRMEELERKWMILK